MYVYVPGEGWELDDSESSTPDQVDETPDCINGPEGCSGRVEYRLPLSGTGKSFPRCDGHWEVRLASEQQIRERYPEHPPADWSPLDAGEAWGEDDY